MSLGKLVVLSFPWVALGCAGATDRAPPARAATGVEGASSGSRDSRGDASPRERSEPSLLETPLCDDRDESEFCGMVRRGEGLLGRGEGPEAEALFGQLVARFPERVEARIGLARALSAGESFAFGTGGPPARRALDLLESLEGPGKTHPLVLLERARLELCLGRAASARERLMALREEWPRDPEVHGALGVALLAEGRVRQSLEPLGRAVVLAPKDVERRLVLGSARMLAEDLEGAEEAFRGALALAPDSPKGHADLGALLLLRGRTREARSHLARALALGGERATLLTNLSYAMLSDGDLEGAKKAATRATELEPEFGSAWLNLGLAEAALGNYAAARTAFLRAQRIDPEDPRVAPNLAELDEVEKSAR